MSFTSSAPVRNPSRLSAALLLGLLLSVLGSAGCRQAAAEAGTGATVRAGGHLTAAVRDDPATFNPYVGTATSVVEVLTHLLHASLVRVDRRSGEVTPGLAERWTHSPDALAWTLSLRRGVRFSDGSPFTARDVAFAFKAVYDPRSNSAVGASLLVNGKPIEVTPIDDFTVLLRFPSRPGSGLQILDNLPILPRHRLEAALNDGTLKDAWTPAARAADVVGAGPFRLAAYEPARTIQLERNPFYWRTDEGGTPLPYLDRLTLAIVRDQNAELMSILTGSIDISAREIRPEHYASLRREAAAGRVQLVDAGISLDPNMLWFNLAPHAYAGDSRKRWLQRDEFRQAISHAVDRQAIVNQVFLGAAVPVFGPVTPGNVPWYDPATAPPPHDRGRAAALFDGLGLIDRNGDGIREDDHDRPVRFSILTQQHDVIRMRTVTAIQEQLRAVGIAVDIVGGDTGTIVQRWSEGRYDAIYFGVEATSYDPANNLDFWLSSGSFHLWNAAQSTPATAWERRIDALMQEQIATMEPDARRRLFSQAQRILVEQQPVICFAAPRLVAVMSPRVVNATAAPLKPLILWNAERLAVRQ